MAPVALVIVVPALAACGSGAGSGSSSASPDARLASASTTVQKNITAYVAAAPRCTRASNPVECVEKEDLTLGGQVHAYANVLAVGHGFSAPAADLSAARNAAQLLANSLEILGDAQPTQANYDQVLNTFNVSTALSSLKSAVAKLQAHGG
jgi:hypothetical protein